jgi:ribitol-5-phosphate 2-dehydrogenase (NADP+) / D-ribitol-5-phosphate cytidylyltransferase
MRTVAVVLAGGSGRRFGGPAPKQLRVLAGKTLIEHSVAAFEAAPAVDATVVVVPAGLTGHTAGLLAGPGYRKLEQVIEGGAARSDSTRQAIAALGDAECNVLFHDAARPLLEQRIIADCVIALADAEAVGVTVPASDTVVEVSDGVVTGTRPRESLARCQTPQGFRLSVIRKAYRLAAADPGFDAAAATDDCGVVLRYLPEVRVRAVRGSERNIKITHPVDLVIAEALLRAPGP